MSTDTLANPVLKYQWPKQDDLDRHFGRMDLGTDGQPTGRWISNNLTRASCPYHLRLSWKPGETIRKFLCHREVRPALETILEEIWILYGRDAQAIKESRMDLFGGCYNFRRMRGGAKLSTHAYGIAIDLDPERNPLGKPYKPGSGMMPMEVVAIFEKYGAEWGGRWGNRCDAQHFQFARTK